MKINIIGSFFGSDGYSSHTRQLANALNDLEDIEVCMSANRPADFLRHVSDKELLMFKRNPDDCDINLCISTPPNWELYMCDNKKFCGFLVWEGSHIPVGWIKILLDKRVKMIFVPSKHTLEAIKNTCNNNLEIMSKVHIVPHGVSTELFFPKKEETIDYNGNKPFTFFYDKGFRHLEDRGGMQYLIQAYLEEFNETDNTMLRLKINNSYGIPNINSILDTLKPKDKVNFPKIEISTENVSYKDLNSFYQESDVFVAPTRCEGFGIGMIQAMACGLSVITSNFGGQTSFVNEKNGWIINGKLEEVKWDMQYEGVFWLTPDINELRKAMREAYEDWKNNNSRVLNEKSIEALKTAFEFTWKNSAIKAQEFLKELV